MLVIGVVGIGAKLYMDLSGSIQKTYESVERSQDEKKRENPVDLKTRVLFSSIDGDRYWGTWDVSIKAVQIR